MTTTSAPLQVADVIKYSEIRTYFVPVNGTIFDQVEEQVFAVNVGESFREFHLTSDSEGNLMAIQLPVVVTAREREHEYLPAFNYGDHVRVDRELYRVEEAPNRNVNLVKVR